MDEQTAAIKIQSVWRMWTIRKRYIDTDTESEYSWDSADMAEAFAEQECHNFHCGGY